VTIYADCSVLFENFNYDGTGPDVFLWYVLFRSRDLAIISSISTKTNRGVAGARKADKLEQKAAFQTGVNLGDIPKKKAENSCVK
jgi:hypothetical protein